MKNVVSLDEIREVEMRPQSVFEEYFRLLEKDIPNFFENKEERERRHCPACASEQYTDRFEKLGFLYRTCDACDTMYVAFRPSDSSLLRYHETSESHAFYVSEYPRTLESVKGQTAFFHGSNG